MTTFRRIEPRDCADVARLHCACFDADEIEISIFASARVDCYLQQIVAFPDAQREYFLCGAWDESELIGYVFGRAAGSTWHLNFMAVLPPHQGRGIGQSLYDLWLQAGRERGWLKASLNVGEGNATARALYENWSWNACGKAWLYRRALPAQTPAKLQDAALQGAAPRALQLANWDAAQAWQASYGFSQIEIVAPDARWTVGRLGEEYFRTGEILPDDVQYLLGRIEPQRGLLVLLPQHEPHWKSHDVRLRMELQLES